MVSDRVFNVFPAVRNLGFQNMIRKNIKELHLYSMGKRKRSMDDEKAIFLTTIKKPPEIHLV